jgi:alkyl hydroperoxide reductase subunit AhpF
MATREFYDGLIIGGGPEGMSDAIYALRASIRRVLIERGVPGEDEYDDKGVRYCAVCDGFFFRDKTVAVVGDGCSTAMAAAHFIEMRRSLAM